MRTHLSEDTVSLAAELGFLAVTAPILLLSGQFPTWAIALALATLAGGWIWRRVRLGHFFTHTPIDMPLLLLFGVMLPVSIWAAPAALRMEISVPRALVMVWAFCLFWTVVTYSSRRYQAVLLLVTGFALSGAAIAVAALLGTQWLYKFPGAETVLSAMPSPLLGVFMGAESGFHPNQVAGTLLYVFPLLLAILVSESRRRKHVDITAPWLPWVIWPSALIMGATLLLAQSRSALLGLVAGMVFMALVNYRWGRIGLVILVAILLVVSPFISSQALDSIGDAPPVEALGGVGSVERFRTILWAQAIAAASDFSLTGMGLGTFRELVRVLYPLDIPPAYDIGHAHNFFLQTALDFGIAGLAAVLAMYLVAAVQLVLIWRWSDAATVGPNQSNAPPGAGRVWATGLAGCFVAQTLYSQLDAVAMGAKTNFMFWYLLALVIGLANYTAFSGFGDQSVDG